jgi:outer membrane protein assembly factor BamE (lipoprotein component of BamABCDE complex)
VDSRRSVAVLYTLVALAAAADLNAQNKVEPIPSSLPANLETTQPPTLPEIRLGQTQQELVKALGRPTRYVLDHVKGGDMAEIWELSPQDTLVVTFRKNIVKSFRHIYSQAEPAGSTSSLNPNLSHQNADGTWSPGGQLTAGDKVSIGEAKEEVLRRLGHPNGPPPSSLSA